jgi:hypothetical protein
MVEDGTAGPTVSSSRASESTPEDENFSENRPRKFPATK